MTSANDLTRLVPGFDFLQGLMKSGGAGMPSIGQWIAPTLEPEVLGKRIDELRTVQFWLEQNARLLGTTIQALEVQRMTLSTLKGMNLPLADLTDALRLSTPKTTPSAATASASTPTSLARSALAAKAARGGKPGKAGPAGAGATPAIDPMQWWGALTQQFTELATKALKDGSADLARNLASAAVKQGMDSAGTSIERVMAMPVKAAGLAAKAGASLTGAAAGRVAAAARKRKA